ncbi:MAG: V-type ATP synthase subunit D [Anaerolineae bacterium]
MSTRDHVDPTRMELLARRAQMALARQGRDLLKDKRNALWKELVTTMDVVSRKSDSLEAVAGEARQALAWAEAFDGREAVESAGLAARRPVSIEVTETNVMGVRTPVIQRQGLRRSSDERGYSLVTTSARIDAAAEEFEMELEDVIDMAVDELRLKRLAEEIRTTTVRVNALETILVPQLEQQCAYIERVLEEREREDLFRLKRVKATMRRRRESADSHNP